MSRQFKQLLAELEMISFSERIQSGTKPVASSALLADFFETLPFPAWIKVLDDDNHLRMAYVNEAYEIHVGITAKEYFSKEDSEVSWTENESTQFLLNDLEAIRTRLPVKTAEIAASKLTGKESIWKGHKWPIIRNDGVIAVCGYALLPILDEEGDDGSN